MIKLKTILLITLLLSGCELLGPDMGGKISIDSLPLETRKTKLEPLTDNSEKDLPASKKIEEPQAEIYLGTGKFIGSRTLKKPALVESTEEGKYTLNFADTEIEVIAKTILGDIFKANYVIDPTLSVKMTVKNIKALKKEDLLPTLEMLLRMNGAVLLKDNDVYHIETIDNAKIYSPIKSGRNIGKIPAGYQVLIMPLDYVSVADMEDILESLLSKETVLRSDKSRNVMILAGNGKELEQAVDVIKTFDVNVMDGMSFGLFPLQRSDAATVIDELEFMLAGKEETALSNMFRFVAIERLNAIMAITPQVRYLQRIETWIARLDKANTTTSNGIRVYEVQHVDAEELANTLSAIIGGTSQNTSSQRNKKPSIAPGRNEGTMSNRANQNKENKTATKSPQEKYSRNIRRNQGDSLASIANLEGVRVVADTVNNALIIVATQTQYESLYAVIEKLDKMPLQVLIDVSIISVTLTDELRYGIRWYFTHNNGGNNGVSSGAGIGLSDLATLAATAINPGFGYSFATASDDIRAVLNAEAKDNKIKVLSSPSLMVLNNQEALIQVGEKIPVRTSELTTDTGTTSNTIQMRETGVSLWVKPRVNADGLVIMKIIQSVDNAIPAGSSGSSSQIDSPSILQRKIESTVAVNHGETVVLGGLINENKSYDVTGIPYLSKIPILGGLFGSTEKTLTRTELVIFITPRVIKTVESGRAIAKEFKRKLKWIYEDLPSQENESN